MVRTDKRPRYPPPPIYPALRSDIPTIVQVWISATRPDLLFQIQRSPDEERFAVVLTEYVTACFNAPGTTILKAVDWKDAEKITAVAIWARRAYSPKELSGDEILKVGVEGAGNQKISPARLCGGLPLDSCTEDESPLPISEYLSEQVKKFAEAWTKGIKHIELVLLMTEPAYQGRGIGTTLLRWGHELADREAVPCFLCATPFGHPLYQSLRWHHVAEPIVLDLKEWVEFGEKGDMGWGIYKLYFMLRLPRTKESDNK